MSENKKQNKNVVLDQALSELAKLIVAGIDERNKPLKGGVRKKYERRNDRSRVDGSDQHRKELGKIEDPPDP